MYYFTSEIGTAPYKGQNISLKVSLVRRFHCNATLCSAPHVRQCDLVEALQSFHRQVFEEPTKLGIIGSGCSVSTEPTASISHHYNLVQVILYVRNAELH